MTLDSPGMVELDTSVVPDILGLRVHYQNDEPTQVLPGRAQNSVCALVPDARAMTRGSMTEHLWIRPVRPVQHFRWKR